MPALKNYCTESLGVGEIFNFPTFNKDSENVHEFISLFTRAAHVCGWSDEKQAQALPLYLKGNASIWFNSLPNKDQTK
jgi:hypothetical protein